MSPCKVFEQNCFCPWLPFSHFGGTYQLVPQPPSYKLLDKPINSIYNVMIRDVYVYIYIHHKSNVAMENSPLSLMIFPLKAQSSSGISQVATFDDTGGYPPQIPAHLSCVLWWQAIGVHLSWLCKGYHPIIVCEAIIVDMDYWIYNDVMWYFMICYDMYIGIFIP